MKISELTGQKCHEKMNETAEPVSVFVLYDGIQNSVFESQVFQPLIRTTLNYSCKILLISFENTLPDKKIIEHVQAYPQVTLHILKKNFFLGLASLWPQIRSLHRILRNLSGFKLTARGPHAGYISHNAIKETKCRHLTIQARGILPEEYAFVHSHAKWPLSWLHTIRKKLFAQLERAAFQTHKQGNVAITIEAVSQALKDYLIKHYKTLPKSLIVATKDIPEPMKTPEHSHWRKIMRDRLGIAPNTHVYCYNGSAKAWQCPKKTIDYFVQQQKKQPNSFLLILTQDTTAFKIYLEKQSLDPSRYHLCTVPHQQVYRYLAACDTGILFREPHIINWVSRPTKLLEYQATHLDIEHNNTIAVLAKK